MMPTRQPASVPTTGTVTTYRETDGVSSVMVIEALMTYPSEHDPCERAPVERLDVTIAECDAQSSAGDAHGSRDGDSEVGRKNDLRQTQVAQ